jgi:hypothetical protein
MVPTHSEVLLEMSYRTSLARSVIDQFGDAVVKAAAPGARRVLPSVVM